MKTTTTVEATQRRMTVEEIREAVSAARLTVETARVAVEELCARYNAIRTQYIEAKAKTRHAETELSSLLKRAANREGKVAARATAAAQKIVQTASPIAKEAIRETVLASMTLEELQAYIEAKRLAS